MGRVVVEMWNSEGTGARYQSGSRNELVGTSQVIEVEAKRRSYKNDPCVRMSECWEKDNTFTLSLFT